MHREEHHYLRRQISAGHLRLGKAMLFDILGAGLYTSGANRVGKHLSTPLLQVQLAIVVRQNQSSSPSDLANCLERGSQLQVAALCSG